MGLLTFSRSKPAEAQFRRILEAGITGISAELAAAAMDLLREKEREMRFQQPKLDFVTKFARLAESYPAAMQTLILASKLGANGEGLVEASEVADEYAAEVEA